MGDLALLIGNRNYSSWSMRAWLALEATGVDFETNVVHLGAPGVRAEIRRHSPSGRVPALRAGQLTVWDSLAIAEYLAERFPGAGLWPADPGERATARSICAEMHAGFSALRAHMPFNVRRSSPGMGRAEGVGEDIERILEIWSGRLSSGGPRGDGAFLFGRWCLADIFFAPVVVRFRTYAVELDSTCRPWAEAVWDHPHVRAWRAAAEAEPWSEPQYDL